jgi:hypothetical protein
MNFDTNSIYILICAISSSLGIVYLVNGHLNKKMGKKADKDYVEREIESIHQRINKKADEKIVKMMHDDIKYIRERIDNLQK